MQLDSTAERIVYIYLKNAGYSSEAITAASVKIPIGDGLNYQPDFTLVDPDTKEILAHIEVKSHSTANIPDKVIAIP